MKAVLLKRVAAIPADEKLPIARFARELNCTQSVVISEIEALARAGKLDPKTWRPFADAPDAPTVKGPVEISPGMPGSALAELLIAEGARRGLAPAAVSRAVFGHNGRLYVLRDSDAPCRRPTIDRARKWLDETPTANSADDERAGLPPARDDGEGAVLGVSAPSITLPDEPSGEVVAAVLRQSARAAGAPISRHLLPLSANPHGFLKSVAEAKKPAPGTIARVRAFLAGEPLPPRSGNAEIPARSMRRDERAAAGLPPSAREIADHAASLRTAEERRAEEEQRLAAERAHETRRPGETLAQAVAREAAALGARRRAAFKPNISGFNAVDADEDDEDVGAIRAARLERERRDVATPSALIRRAQAEWPDKCRKVAALACQMGIKLGEAWDQVIGAGILAIEDNLKEEQA